MQAPRTGPTTTPNTTLIPTTKPIEARMQVTGHRWVLKPIPRLLLPMSPRFFPHRFSLFQDKNFHPLVTNLVPNALRGWKISFHIYHYICKLNIIFPTMCIFAARVCRSQDSWVWTDQPQIYRRRRGIRNTGAYETLTK